MKKYDLSDRKLKIAIILAMAMIAWLCLKGASASDIEPSEGALAVGLGSIFVYRFA